MDEINMKTLKAVFAWCSALEIGISFFSNFKYDKKIYIIENKSLDWYIEKVNIHNALSLALIVSSWGQCAVSCVQL